MPSQDLGVAIDRLLLWSSQWQLKIANEKCLVLRTCVSNHRRISSCLHPTYRPSINSHFLDTEIRDLGIIVDRGVAENAGVENRLGVLET